MRLPPPMQPTHQHASAGQVVKPTHTRFGMEALEDMITMGRTMSDSSAPAASDSHHHVAAAHAAAVHQQPPTQHSHHMTAASQPGRTHIRLTETKKIKLDSDGLIAVETSRTVTAQQSASRHQQDSSGLVAMSDLTYPGLAMRHLGSNFDSPRPSGDVMAGLTPGTAVVMPSLLHSSAAAAAATPSPQFQGIAEGVPNWGPPMMSYDSRSWTPHSSSSSSPQLTPHSAPPSARRFTSGQGQVSLQACSTSLAWLLHLPCKPEETLTTAITVCHAFVVAPCILTADTQKHAAFSFC